MKIILLKDVPKLGRRGEVKNVSDGYARNFLFARNLAELATEITIKKVEIEKNSEKIKQEKTHEQFHALRESLLDRGLIIYKKADEKGNLYAGITAEDIIEGLKIAKYIVPEKLNKKMIDFPKHIKSVGEHRAYIAFGQGEKIELKIVVEIES